MFKIDCDDITSEQYFEFIKKHHDTKENPLKSTQHHMDFFEEYKKSGRIVHWNWCAAIPTTLWMLYRKMYLIFFLSWAILDLDFIFSLFLKGGSFSLILSIAWRVAGIVVFGLFGDYFYLFFATHKMNQGITHKGVSFKGPIIFLVALLLLLLTLPFILFSLMLYFPSFVPMISWLASMYKTI